MSTVIETLDKAQTFHVWEKPPSRKRVVGHHDVFRDEETSLRLARLVQGSPHGRTGSERRSAYPSGSRDPGLAMAQLAHRMLALQMRQQRIEVLRAGYRNEHALRIVERYRLQTQRPSLLRIGGLTGLAVMFASIPLLLASISIGLIGMYAGFGLFALANYAAYRAGERNYIIGPSVSAALAGASFLLAFIALAGTF